MKTLKKINIKPVTVEYIPDKKDMIQDEIYISVKYRTAVHLCLCGCGNVSVTPFIDDSDWRVFISNNGLSIVPSILNMNCPNHYHYIITNNIANVV